MEWEEVIANLQEGYTAEIDCYQKLLHSLKETKEEFLRDNLHNVLLLQDEQRKVMGNIDALEQILLPYKEEWEKFKKQAPVTASYSSLLAKIKQVENLLSDLLRLEEDSIAELSNRKLLTMTEMKKHRLKKNGHTAYRRAANNEAIFLDRKS